MTHSKLALRTPLARALARVACCVPALAIASSACTHAIGDGAKARDSRVDTSSLSTAYDALAPQRLSAAWADWKASWVTTSGAGGGARVLFQEGSGVPGDASQGTVSEGIGYGMLLAVYFDEQPLFDALHRYFRAHVNSHGLMGWKVRSDGGFDQSAGGASSATDGDEDIAAALALAAAKWSNASYREAAIGLANSIMKYEIDSTGGRDQPAPTFAILAGDWNASAPIDFNPSYFAPAWYRLFQSVTGDTRWQSVIDEGYAVLDRATDANTGLVSQDRRVDGSSYNGQDTYEYNAFRVPFRLAVDQLWFGDARARDHVARIATFYSGVINANHAALNDPRVYASRSLDGTVLGRYESGGFTATACVALLANGLADQGRYLYDVLWSDGRAGDMKQYYYDGAWHLLGALLASNNFPNLAAGKGTTPPPAAPAFMISASSRLDATAAPRRATITVSVASEGTTYPSALIDVELHDAANQRVAQTWFSRVALDDGSTRTFSWVVDAPSAAGAYSIDVGVFTDDWSKAYTYVSAGTLTVP